MICPKCGSNHVQFVSNTTGSGFSAGKACCGYIIFGYIGVILGACGGNKKAKEFWICNSCGNRFSDLEAKTAMMSEEDRRKKEEKCKQYQREIDDKNITLEEVIIKIEEIESILSDVREKRLDHLEKLMRSRNEEIRKYAKILHSKLTLIPVALLVIACLVGLIQLFTNFFKGLAAIVFSFLGLYAIMRFEKSISAKLCSLDRQFEQVESYCDYLEDEKKEWENLKEKFEYIKKHGKM